MRLSKFGLFVLFLLLSLTHSYAQQTYYWIGGSGDFQDPSHWSLTSGGGPAFLNPNNQDNVIFDQNSFTGPGQTVTTSNNIFVRDMDWSAVTNTPTFQVDAFDINIHGSLILANDMNHDVQTDYIFRASDPGHIINRNGQFFEQNVIFEGVGGGEWTLASDLQVVGIIEFNSGTFNSNNEFIGALSMIAAFGSDVTINLGTSDIFLIQTNTVQPQLLMNGDNITFIADQANFILWGVDSRVILRGESVYSIGSITFTGSGMGTIQSDVGGGSVEPMINNLVFEGNGLILGGHFISTLTLANSFTVKLENGVRQIVDRIETSGTGCEGDARLIWQFEVEPKAILDLFTNSLVAPVFYRGIFFDAPNTVTLNGGIDGGNNEGNYNPFPPEDRTLFWIGANDDWNDPANWSETSGGPGGACIPRAVDNVIIDDNSFTNMAIPVMITNDLPIYLNSFEFTYSGNAQVIIIMPELHIVADQNNLKDKASSLIISESLIWNILDVFIEGTNQGGTQQDNQFIDVTVNVINNLHISASSEDTSNPPQVILENDLRVQGSLDITGLVNFRSDGYNIETPIFLAEGIGVRLFVGNSIITITGEYNGVTYPLTITDINAISATGTEWIFNPNNPSNDTGFSIDEGAIGSVTFANDMSTARMLSGGIVMIDRLEINADGNFGGVEIEMDSLIFHAGHTYITNAGMELEVEEYFEGLGDICNAITFATPGTSEEISLNPDIELRLSFITIENIDAVGGGSDYFAGPGSAGMNAANWRFPTAGENTTAQQFLGQDIDACSDSTIVFSPGDDISIDDIQWIVNNGASTSNDLTFTVDPSVNNLEAVITTTSGCTVRDTVRIDVDQAFTYDLGMDSVDVCQGATLRLQDSDFVNIGAQFIWNTGETSPSIIVNSTRDINVTVTKGNCTETDAIAVRRIDLEDFSTVFTQDTLRFCGSETEVISAPDFERSTSMFEWNDGTSTSTLTLSESSLPGDGYYRLFVSEGACSDQDSMQVIFDPEITQVLPDIMDTVLCEGESYIQSVLPGFDSVIWHTGSTDLSIMVDASSIMNSQTLMVEAFSGACNETAERNVTVSNVTKPQLGADVTLCESEGSLQLIKPTSVSLPIQWYLNDELAEDVNDTLRVPIILGSRLYVLEVIDATCTNRDSVIVTYEAAPNIALGNDTLICQNQSVTLTVPNDLDDWTWSNSAQMTLTTTVSTADTVSVEASRGTCLVEDTIIVSVLDLTALNIGPPDTTLCEGEVLVLDASVAGGNNYEWSTLETGPMISVTESDQYSVSVSADGCSESDVINVVFDPALPLFNLHQDLNRIDSVICTGDAATYNFNISNASYLWEDFDQNELSRSGDFTINDEGEYVLNISSGACTASDTLVVMIQALPEVMLQDTIFSCEGNMETIDATTGNASYLWNTGESTAVINIVDNGTYTVTVTENRCPNEASSVAVFRPLPTAQLRADTVICDLDSLNLSFNDASLTYNWVTPSGASSDMSVIAKENGNYIVEVMDQNNCVNRDTFILTVNPTPFFDWPDTTSFCDGVEFDLSVPTTVDPTRYRWSNFDGNPSITIRDEGLVWVDVFIGPAPGQECKWTDTTYILARPFPEVTFSDDSPTICSDSLHIIDATTEGASYIWSTGATTSTITVSDAATYSVTVSLTGCEDEGEVTVTTIQAPEVTLSMDTVICEDETLTLQVNDPSWTILWSTGETTSSIDVVGGAMYSVQVEENGCTDEDDIFVDESPLPVFNLGDDIFICDEVGTLLSVDIPNVTVDWNTSDTGPNLTVSQPGTYSATAISSAGCEFVDEIVITQRECVRFALYRPQIFSPNNPNLQNGENGIFKITPAPTAIITDYEIQIFNRWGNLMYSSRDINEGWDGRVNSAGSEYAKPGVYAYVIKITYTDDFDADRQDVFHGDVTLIN